MTVIIFLLAIAVMGLCFVAWMLICHTPLSKPSITDFRQKRRIALRRAVKKYLK